jgi:hypothetical protein
MRIQLSTIPGIVLVAMLSFAAAALTQEPPPVPTPRTPDLLGIYPGMPMRAAVAQLQKRSSDVYVSVDPAHGFSLATDTPESADVVSAKVTQPPDAFPSVWMITRSWNHTPNSTRGSMTASALLRGLHAKYGPETLRKVGSSGATTLFWIFDPNGKLLAHADPALMNCSGEAYGPSVWAGSLGPFTDVCAKSFFAVTANFTAWPPGGDPIVNAYQLELVNLPYALRMAVITANAKNAAAKRALQSQQQKASHNVPKF